MIRDTDKDWAAIAKNYPYYGVLANSRFLNPTENDLIDFFKTGDEDISYILSVIRRVFGDFNPNSALDFGCGVGRLLIPLAKICSYAVGIDIADRMIELAREHCSASNVKVDFFREIPNDRNFDWVNSQIVLQHIPPSRGYGLIRDLWRSVAPNGVFCVHLTIYKDSRHTGELTRDLQIFRYDGETVFNWADTNVGEGMSMYDYDLSRVLSCLDETCPIYLERTDHGGCHGVRLYLRKHQ